jgi:hypothetical protein
MSGIAELNLFTFVYLQSISFIGGTTLATLVVTCLAVGRLCELHGPRILGICGTLVTVVGLLAASWCHSVSTLIVTQGEAGGLCTSKYGLSLTKVGVQELYRV